MIKTPIRNRLSDSSLSILTNIAIESPNTMRDRILEEMVDICKRKGRKFSV